MNLPPAKHSISPTRGLGRWVFLALAGCFFALGVLGAVLPGLPTTPFLLLTSFFLVRSSPRLHRRLLASRWFGPILRDWQEQGGLRPGVKAAALGTIGVLVPAGLYWSQPGIGLSLLVVALAAVGVLVVWRLPRAVQAPPSPQGNGESPARPSAARQSPRRRCGQTAA